MENFYWKKKMKTIFLVCLTITMIGCLCICASRQGNEMIAMNSVYNLTESELNDCIIQSHNGDGEASLRVAKYYSMYLCEIEKALVYYKEGADNDNSACQYHYAFYLLELYENSYKEEAVYYLKQAASNGEKHAVEILSELGETL